jgi:hypothetical protein
MGNIIKSFAETGDVASTQVAETNIAYLNEGKKKKEKKTSFVRLIFYGGAKTSSHNSSFQFAAKNVKKDYSDGNVLLLYAKSGKYIVDTINGYGENEIQSIDFISHQGVKGVYIIFGSSTDKSISSDDVESKNLNAGLYGSKTLLLSASDDHSDIDVINRIEYSNFTKTAKIEFHGCDTDTMIIIDSIAENFSDYLYSNSKDKAVVIAHTKKANPNINGSTTTNEQQDYRHGERVVIHNGKVKHTTSKKGRILFSEYEDKI